MDTPILQTFQKSIASEIAAIDKLLSKTERSVKRAFLEYLKNAKSEETLKTVRKLLEQGNINGVIQHFERLTIGLSQPITAAMIEAGIAETRITASKAARAALKQNGIEIPQVAFQFDPANPQAAEAMRQHVMRVLENINATQSKVIQATIVQAQIDGTGPLATARKIRDEVGLTEFQKNAVDNYERLLRENNSQALSRGLRDRRFDRSVKSDKPLTNEQIEKMTTAYRRRYIAYRSEVIARTEAHTAINLAREQSLNQTVEQAGLQPGTVKRRWMATQDKRTRDTHSAMGFEKQTVGLNEPFTSPSGAKIMYPGDANAPAAERIQCRCTTITEFMTPN